LPLSKIEIAFIAVPIVILSAIAFNVLDSPTEIGPRLHGKITTCQGHGNFVPRTCVFEFGPADSKIVNIQLGGIGEGVTVVLLKKRISGSAYYAVVRTSDP